MRSDVSAIEKNIATSLEASVTTSTYWDKLPGEVKNLIYEYLLTGDSLIHPCVYKSNGITTPNHHNLGGQLLYVNSSVHKEALSILFSKNLFVLNRDLEKYLGSSPKPLGVPSKVPTAAMRTAMIKKVTIRDIEFNRDRRIMLGKIRGLDKVVIYHLYGKVKSQHQTYPEDKDWHAKVKDMFGPPAEGLGWRRHLNKTFMVKGKEWLRQVQFIYTINCQAVPADGITWDWMQAQFYILSKWKIVPDLANSTLPACNIELMASKKGKRWIEYGEVSLYGAEDESSA